ncbi:MAG: hypothetical protein AAGJ84_11475 [Pseudomonadota bacterium]
MSLLSSRPRLKRYIGALIATAVTTWIAAHNLARGDEPDTTCSRDDVAIWHLALLETDPTPSPLMILEKTETFLAACPDRPETDQARAIAGMASVELGNAAAAVSYFDQVQYFTTVRQQLNYSAALLSVGRDADAWTERDELIANWLERVAQSGDVQTAMRVLEHGRLVHLLFSAEARLDGLRSAWVVLPDGPGWPASIRMTQQAEGRPQRAVFSESAADEPLFVELYQCRSRRLLGRVSLDVSAAQTHANAQAALTAYLNAPDSVSAAASSSEIQTCFWPDHLLPPPRG